MAASHLGEIARAFAERGGEAYGEDVSQLDHALQCAALAQEEAAGDALVAAALLHDFGHLFEGGEAADRDARHEALGASALRRWFGPAVVGPIALHVQAKRYLCAVEPAYRAGLSAASARSLALQGGPMSAEQCRRFESRPFASDAVRLRRWDDAGKVSGRAAPGLEAYWPILQRVRTSP